MSGFFATQRDEAQAYADAAEQGYANSLRPPERPIVGDVFGETQRGLRRAGANIIGSVSAFGETIGRARDRGLLGSGLNPYQAEDEDPGDYWSRFVEGHRETQERAREVREALMPDPETTGYAAEFIGTFAEQIAPSVALGVAGSSLGTAASTTGAVVGMGATGGFATEADMLAQGVDPATAAEAGAISGAILGGSVFLPASMTGRLTTRIASGAAINVPQGMAERAALSGYLRSRGYEEQAARYQWADASQIAIDAVIGGFFGGAFGERPTLRQGEGREQEGDAIDSQAVSAAMVQSDLIHRQLTTAPGIPVSRADEGAHHAALRQAQEQMANDERVDLSGTGIEDANFIEKDQALSDADWDIVQQVMREEGLPEVADDLAQANARAQEVGLPPENLMFSMRERGVRAFHGSPHDFDRFDMSKIGTGEGAQAYGHGLYFAENENVARGYRDSLAGFDYFVDGSPFDARDPVHVAALEKRRRPLGNDAIGYLRYQSSLSRDPVERRTMAAAARFLKGDGALPLVHAKPKGRMYEVNIDADPADFLDWDAPLSAQPRAVRDFIPQPLRRNDTGAGYHAIIGLEASKGGRTPPMVAAAARLRDAGIPGIRYLDAGSRSAGEGSRNYVLFRDDIIDIVRKYSLGSTFSGASPEQLRAGLIKYFGTSAEQLFSTARVEIVGDTGELAAKLGLPVPANVKGVYNSNDGKVYLVARNISPDEAAGVMLHEVGVHAGMRDMLGEKLFSQLTRELEALTDNPLVQNVYETVDRLIENGQMRPEHRAEEALAYVVETAPDLPLVKRILASLRQWLWRTFKGAQWLGTLSVDDIRMMAVASLRRQAALAAREARTAEAVAAPAPQPQQPLRPLAPRTLTPIDQEFLDYLTRYPDATNEELARNILPGDTWSPEVSRVVDRYRARIASRLTPDMAQRGEPARIGEMPEGANDSAAPYRTTYDDFLELDADPMFIGNDVSAQIFAETHPELANMSDYEAAAFAQELRNLQARRSDANGTRPTLVVDNTRGDGSNLLASARLSGYEGSDIGEAVEWVRARAKGLDMSLEARMQRAREMGFDTETRLYHGTDNTFDGFDVRAAGSGANAGLKERGVFLTDSPAVADSYLGGGYVKAANANEGAADIGDGVARWYGTGSQTLPVYVRAIDKLEQWDWGGGGYTPQDMKRVIAEARKGGASGVVLRSIKDPGILDTIGPVGNPRRPSNLVVIFDPRNIRSIHAAFDPDFSDSPNLLASRSWDDLERLMSDTRRPRSVGRRTPPPNIPDPGTPEYDAALQEARTAQESGQRLTPTQRALLDWEKSTFTQPRLRIIDEPAPGVPPSELFGDRHLRLEMPDGQTVVFQLGRNSGGGDTFINNPTLPANLRGKGLGGVVFRAAVDDALSKGIAFTSGEMVSPDGMRLWESLIKRGYQVERGEYFPELMDGYYQSKDGRPLFRATAMPKGGDLMFSFGGPRSESLAPVIKQAQDWAKERKSAAYIWQRTWDEFGVGAYKGTDGEWRVEIDDSQAKFKQEALVPLKQNFSSTPDSIDLQFSGRMGDIIDHPGLYKAYPWLEDQEIKGVIGWGGKGSYNSKTKEIWAQGKDSAEALSAILHEIQHRIQDFEGRSHGGNWKTEQRRTKRLLDRVSEVLEKTPEVGIGHNSRAALIEARDALQETLRILDPWGDLQTGERNVWDIGTRAQWAAYENERSEVEARNVQTRMRMQPDQRRDSHPNQTIDVKESDIYDARGGVALSSEQDAALLDAARQSATRHELPVDQVLHVADWPSFHEHGAQFLLFHAKEEMLILTRGIERMTRELLNLPPAMSPKGIVAAWKRAVEPLERYKFPTRAELEAKITAARAQLPRATARLEAFSAVAEIGPPTIRTRGLEIDDLLNLEADQGVSLSERRIFQRDSNPARQAILDDPSLRIPTENGGAEKAADAMERAEAAQQAAQEMGKGYAAAASCAVQHGIDQAATRAFRTIAAGQGLGAALAIPGAYAVSRGLDAQMASTDFARQRADRERGMRLDERGFLDAPTQAAPNVSMEAIAAARPYNPPAEGSNDGYERLADGSIDTPYGAAKSPPAPASFMGGPEDADQ